MRILNFLSLITFTHFSHLLSYESDAIEYHLLSSLRILKTEDLLTSQIYNFTHCKASHNNIMKMEFCIFITLFLQHLPNWTRPSKKCVSLFNKWPGYAPIIPCYLFFRLSGSLSEFSRGQHRILSLHAVPFWGLT